MSNGDTGGDIVQTRGEMTFEWKIIDFFSLPDKVDDCYYSPTFDFADAQWYLQLLPNGETDDSTEGWMGIYIFREDTGPPKTVYYTFGIKVSDGVEKVEGEKYEFSAEDRVDGFPKWCSRSELIDRKSTLLPNNSLTVKCDLRSDATFLLKI